MRLRSLVLPAVLAVGAAVIAPAPAQAAVQCGLIVPTKVVINAAVVESDITLTSGCFTNDADHAYWDFVHMGSGIGFPMQFDAEALADDNPYFYMDWYDDDPMGKWDVMADEAATAGGDPLTQNDAVIQVKYGSKLTAAVTRTSTKLTWAATATQWSGRSHKNVGRPSVTVGLFHQTKTGAAWTYVKSVKTSSTGKATVSVTSPKSGNYRLVIAETPTVWAAYSTTIKGRV